MYRNLRQKQACLYSCTIWTVNSKIDVSSNSHPLYNSGKVLCYRNQRLCFLAKTTIKFSRHTIFHRSHEIATENKLSIQVLLHLFTAHQSLVQELHNNRIYFLFTFMIRCLGNCIGFQTQAQLCISVCTGIHTLILSKEVKNTVVNVTHSGCGGLGATLILTQTY